MTTSTSSDPRQHTPDGSAVPRERHFAETVFRVRESGILFVLVLFVVVTTILQPRFLSTTNIDFILVNTSIFALLAIGETVVIVSRNYDLSIGSVLGLSAFLSTNLFGQVPGIPIVVVFLVGLGIGLACGVVNGIIVAVGRVPSLVVTLATMYMIQGLAILIIGGREVVAQTLPDAFIAIPRETIFGIPYIAIAIAVIVGLAAYYLRSFRAGRELYAMGSNPAAATLAGIRVARREFLAFAFSGAIAGVAGVLWAAQYETVNSSAGDNYVLQVIAAVVVGGVAIFGGSGSVVGAALGALLLNTINTALNVLGISPFWDQTIAGALLLVAIALDQVISIRLMAALRGRSRHGVA